MRCDLHPPYPQVSDFETAVNYRRKHVVWQRAKNISYPILSKRLNPTRLYPEVDTETKPLQGAGFE
jgi:hypothetical protein